MQYHGFGFPKPLAAFPEVRNERRCWRERNRRVSFSTAPSVAANANFPQGNLSDCILSKPPAASSFILVKDGLRHIAYQGKRRLEIFRSLRQGPTHTSPAKLARNGIIRPNHTSITDAFNLIPRLLPSFSRRTESPVFRMSLGDLLRGNCG